LFTLRLIGFNVLNLYIGTNLPYHNPYNNCIGRRLPPSKSCHSYSGISLKALYVNNVSGKTILPSSTKFNGYTGIKRPPESNAK
jgi:hypothetical protein